MVLRWNKQGDYRDAHVGHRCSGIDIDDSARFCSYNRDESILSSLKFRIGVVGLKKFLDVLYCVIRGIQDFFV